MKQTWNVIGLMSGTSLDGIDIVFTSFLKTNDAYTYKVLNSETIEYSKKWKENLQNAFYKSTEEIDELNINYGIFLGETINNFIKKHSLKNIDFIASHGHTIFHKPNEGYTLQIGDGKQIYQTTGIKTICDFRTQDVKLKGQGAPLVPIGDKLLFSEFDYCLNLGGFSNISFQNNNQRLAYDICPVNIVLNYYVKGLGVDFDNKGEFSKSGKINLELLQKLNNIPFYKLPIPKSLGFEFVETEILPLIDSYKLSIKDVLRTFVEHISIKITEQIKNSPSKKILVTGGGAFNLFLMKLIQDKTNCKLIIPSTNLINYKEAIVFAFLGVLKNNGEINCLSSVTGAIKDHSSGKIYI